MTDGQTEFVTLMTVFGSKGDVSHIDDYTDANNRNEKKLAACLNEGYYIVQATPYELDGIVWITYVLYRQDVYKDEAPKTLVRNLFDNSEQGSGSS